VANATRRPIVVTAQVLGVLGVLGLAVPATGQPRPTRTSASRPARERAPVPTTVAACARALSRSNGPVWHRTLDGELEQELPGACGGGYERRSQSNDPCRDGCFIADGVRELALAGRFREGNLLLVLGHSGRRFTPAVWLKLPAGEVQLLDLEAADRVRRSLGAVHGAASSQPRIAAGERVSFYVLGWRQERDGWHGELSAAIRAGGGLKLVSVTHATTREPAPVLRAASHTPAARAPVAR
jgi:hypothetical protein